MKPITDPDERKATPAVIAAELGWWRGAQFGWSWNALLDVAERSYWRNRAAVVEGRAG